MVFFRCLKWKWVFIESTRTPWSIPTYKAPSTYKGPRILMSVYHIQPMEHSMPDKGDRSCAD